MAHSSLPKSSKDGHEECVRAFLGHALLNSLFFAHGFTELACKARAGLIEEVRCLTVRSTKVVLFLDGIHLNDV